MAWAGLAQRLLAQRRNGALEEQRREMAHQKSERLRLAREQAQCALGSKSTVNCVF